MNNCYIQLISDFIVLDDRMCARAVISGISAFRGAEILCYFVVHHSVIHMDSYSEFYKDTLTNRDFASNKLYFNVQL